MSSSNEVDMNTLGVILLMSSVVLLFGFVWWSTRDSRKNDKDDVYIDRRFK